jgi:hypothetical protein
MIQLSLWSLFLLKIFEYFLAYKIIAIITMNLSKIANDVTFQFIGGALISTFTNSFFENKSVNNSTVLVVGVEILAQLIADRFLTYSYFKMLIKRNYINNADPTRNLAFILSFIVS